MMRALKRPHAIVQLIHVLHEDSCMQAGIREKLDYKIHSKLQ